jgi:hypothetical protein
MPQLSDNYRSGRETGSLSEGACSNTLLAEGKPVPCVREHWQYSSSGRETGFLCEGARGNTLLAEGKPVPCVREHVAILY